MPRPLSPQETMLVAKVGSQASIDLAGLERHRDALIALGEDEFGELLTELRATEDTLVRLRDEARKVLDAGEV